MFHKNHQKHTKLNTKSANKVAAPLIRNINLKDKKTQKKTGMIQLEVVVPLIGIRI